MKRILFLPLFLALFLVACSTEALPVEPPLTSPTAAASDGAALYAQNCSSCHGELGEGGIGPALTHLGDHSDEELVEIITSGLPDKGMPPWGNRLSSEEILAIVGYLRSLGGEESMGHEEETPQAVVSNVSLDLSLSLQAGEVIAQATLKDSSGKGMGRQAVAFNLRTAVGGSLPLGTATTDAQGVAEFRYDPGEAPSLRLEAVYQPSEESESVQAQAEIEMPGGDEIQPISPGLFSPGPPLPVVLFLAMLAGGVWLTYAWVGWQLLGIIRTREDKPEGRWLQRPSRR